MQTRNQASPWKHVLTENYAYLSRANIRIYDDAQSSSLISDALNPAPRGSRCVGRICIFIRCTYGYVRIVDVGASATRSAKRSIGDSKRDRENKTSGYGTCLEEARRWNSKTATIARKVTTPKAKYQDCISKYNPIFAAWWRIDDNSNIFLAERDTEITDRM